MVHKRNDKKELQMKLKTFVATVCLTLFSTAAVAKCDGDPAKEMEILALNMYHEARGEGRTAMQMVGEVTLNRVASGEYPDTICGVVYQKGQFSWVTKKDHTPYEKEAWETALEIAHDLLNQDIGNLYIFDNGATHFANLEVLRNPPRWTRTFDKVTKVGSHTFYRM